MDKEQEQYERSGETYRNHRAFDLDFDRDHAERQRQ